MFEFNWQEYVQADMEGSDTDTRRRAATELVRALTDKFPAEVRAGNGLEYGLGVVERKNVMHELLWENGTLCVSEEKCLEISDMPCAS